MSSEPSVGFNQPVPAEEEDRIAALLRLHLARDEISSRAGSGSSRYQYLPTNKAVELANYIFGYDGWSSSIQDVTIDFLEESKEGRWNVGVSTIMRITLRGDSYHEDVGYGQTVNMPGKAEALEKAKKEACSDGLKRALRLFGNKLGNCISDQAYMQLLKSGKGQKESLDLSTSPRKRMRLEPALTASTQLQQHNNNTASLPPQSATTEGYPASPQQPYQQPPISSPIKPESPSTAAPPLSTSPTAPSAAALAAYNRQPGPPPPVVAPSTASYPYKPRIASPAPPRAMAGKENAVGGSTAMETSGTLAPLPSIHGIIHSLPAHAHAAATPYSSSTVFPSTVKQEIPTATAPYGPPSTAPRALATNQSYPNNNTASRPFGQPPSVHAMVDHSAWSMSAAASSAATFPPSDSGGGFVVHEGCSASAPLVEAGGSFFGADDDDSSGFISQWLTHNGAGGAQTTAAEAHPA